MAVEVSALGLDCHKCHETPDLQRYRGCLVPTEKVQHITRDGTKLYRCPSKYINPEIKYYIDWYYYFKQGRKIVNAPILRYPAKLLEIFDIIDRTERMIQEDRDKFMKEVYDRGTKKWHKTAESK